MLFLLLALLGMALICWRISARNLLPRNRPFRSEQYCLIKAQSSYCLLVLDLLAMLRVTALACVCTLNLKNVVARSSDPIFLHPCTHPYAIEPPHQ